MNEPMTDAELAEIEHQLTEAVDRCGELYLVTDAPKDMRRILAEVKRLRGEVHMHRMSHGVAVGDAYNQHTKDQAARIAEAQAYIDRVKARHRPVDVDWSASPKCAQSHGPGWVNWPCPDAAAVGFLER